MAGRHVEYVIDYLTDERLEMRRRCKNRINRSLFLRMMFVFCAFISATTLSGKTNINEQRKLLKKYDLWSDSTIQGVYRDAPHLFWRYVQDNNKQYQQVINAARKGKARKAQEVISLAIAEIQESYKPGEYVEGISELLDSLKYRSGIMTLYPNEAQLNLDWSRSVNAYTIPDGAVFLNAGLLLRLECDYNLLMAAYAHELSHFVLQHAFCKVYYNQKKAKKNNILSAIASATVVSAGAFADMRFAESCTYANITKSTLPLIDAIIRGSDENARTYAIKYNREQEYEADIIGYRFLEAIGIDGSYYIEMLNRIKSELEIFSNDESSHPLIEDRISLLEFMRSKPNLKRKPVDSGDDIYYREEY